ncbi:hypothetical protein M758_6G191000 [Ceratodon purpureus]|nr:hypothetical protein M758_6G191000 [Ceratodon purpureus]
MLTCSKMIRWQALMWIPSTGMAGVFRGHCRSNFSHDLRWNWMFHKSASCSKESGYLGSDEVILECAQCAPDSSLRSAGTPSAAVYNLRRKMTTECARIPIKSVLVISFYIYKHVLRWT